MFPKNALDSVARNRWQIAFIACEKYRTKTLIPAHVSSRSSWLIRHRLRSHIVNTIMTEQKSPYQLENNSSASEVPSQSAATGTGAGAKQKSSALLWLLPALAAVAAGAVVLPGVLQKMYLEQEEAAKSKGNIVGTRTDTKPPPGKSTDPYASLNQNRGGGDSGAKQDDAAKKDDSKEGEAK